MHASMAIRLAARVIRAGGVVACPTEGVYGFSCRPDDRDAAAQLVALKGRSAAMGFVLIAADLPMLDGWVAADRGALRRLAPSAAHPVTWVLPAGPLAGDWLTGGRGTLAVRLVGHPLAAALCRRAGMPLVSTSANRHGKPPARSALAVRRHFPRGIDYITGGAVGPARGPSEIRDGASGRVLRRRQDAAPAARHFLLK